MEAGLSTIDYVVLFVADVDRSIEFYRDKIGLELKMTGRGYAEFATTNTKFALYDEQLLSELIGKGTRPGGPRLELVFVVDDADAHAELLRNKGVAIVAGPTDRAWGHRTVHVQDPDGNVVEFAQEIERSD